MKNLIKIFILTIVAITLNSCQKNETTSDKGSLKIEIDHLANGTSLELGKNYTNAAGETLNFSLVKYYLSNFSLVKTDGTIYTLPKDECYYLIEEPTNGANTILTLNNIPKGEYKEIRFMVGVDSLKNTAPTSERTGVLDPATCGMYWSWNSGYIFLKVEGKSPAVATNPNASGDNFAYHIGLYGGMTSATQNNIKSISLSKDGEIASVNGTIVPNAHITVDIMEIFKTPNVMSLANIPTIHVSPNAKMVADNYADMFNLDHIHN